MNQEVLDNIKRLRKRAGLSQLEIAEKLNISQSAYSKIEIGRTPISEFYLYKLPGILGCKLEDILTPEALKDYKTELLPYRNTAEEPISKYGSLSNEALGKHIELLEKAIKDKEDIIKLLQKELKRLEEIEKGKS